MNENVLLLPNSINTITSLIIKSYKFHRSLSYKISRDEVDIMTCFSRAGFQCISIITKWLAPIKFKPTPPAFSETNKTYKYMLSFVKVQSILKSTCKCRGSSLKVVTVCNLLFDDILPHIVSWVIFSWFK